MRCRSLLIVATLTCFAMFTTIARPNDAADGSKARKREASELTQHLANLHLHRIYVSDFADASRGYTMLARFLAATFSKFMTDDADGLAILNRSEAHKFLDKNGWTDSDLSRPEVISQFAAAFSVDEIIKTWKLEPAHDADGHPVAVLTPLEVVFRLGP